MRVVEVEAFGGPEVLRLVDRPDPPAKAGEVRVRVAATTIGPTDEAIRAGVFRTALPTLVPPFVLGWDFAGTTLDPVEGIAVGTPVAGMVPWMEVPGARGTWAEIIYVKPEWLAVIPSGVSFLSAATLPLNALSATQGLALLDVKPGQMIAITGASGEMARFV